LKFMWHQSLSSAPLLRTLSSATAFTLSSATALWLSSMSMVLAQTSETRPEPVAPTARYAQGEDVDLAEIIAEWRGYYVDIPIYLCVCQDSTCDQTSQWPYREYDRYQLSVALGPTNGKQTEANGFNCSDIADRSQPSNPRDFSTAEVGSPEAAAITPTEDASPLPDTSLTPPPPAPVVTPPPTPTVADTPAPTTSIPNVTVINDGAGIRLDWDSGSSNVINVTDSQWNITILNALDCESLSVVEQKLMTVERVQGVPTVNAQTGHVAVPVLLDSCIETDQMGVFVLDPEEDGSYALYRTQLPEVRGPLSAADRSFPDELSSYAYSTIVDMRYWDSSLLVHHGSASGAEAILVFRPGRSPAGFYAGCAVVNNQEGASVLCDQE
ncbi:MAG: hypothetical protein AAFQ95_17700, partial [Cyanobacteria bacterium J06621_3]